MFILLNVIAFFHAYKFTHFSEADIKKTNSPSELSTSEKLKTLLFGINNPKPQNKITPKKSYNTIYIKSNKKIECWEIKSSLSIGTVIIFHGYSGEKSSMLDKADVFLDLGYNVLLVDFMGSGGSEGTQTTLGYYEAIEVLSAFNYIVDSGEKNIFLFGTSMGAVAIMKAIADYGISPNGIILECPFGSMYETVCARFKKMSVPSFPMAGLLVFWGGIQNNFWAFSHKPTDYANSIESPTLLLHGAKDESVSLKEINEIYKNISSKKQLIIYENAGHENYLNKYSAKWKQDVCGFLKTSK